MNCITKFLIISQFYKTVLKLEQFSSIIGQPVLTFRFNSSGLTEYHDTNINWDFIKYMKANNIYLHS